MSTETMTRTDEEIQRDVIEQLRWDARVQANEIGVAAKDGVVTLTGRVAFDEDHTQRVASPIDGRAVALLVRPGDTVRVGQPVIGLSSPHVAQLQADSQKAA